MTMDWRRTGRRLTPALVGSSTAIAAVRATIERIAASNATVLITGPTGTGKEVVAAMLHARGPRSAKPFVAVNCGAIPASLAESEFLGHEAGAFTGATRARPGRFEAADGGTLFLDEVGELPLDMQVKLLRAIETRSVERVGGGRPQQVDVRLIAATNRDLAQAVAGGGFREDFYWRLAVVTIDLPPLHDRHEDVRALIDHFCATLPRAEHLRFDSAALRLLERHAWPGKVRELRNLIERAAALGLCAVGEDDARQLLRPGTRPVPAWLSSPPQGRSAPAPQRLPFAVAGTAEGADLRRLLAEVENAMIAQALERCGGTVADAARLLGMNRTTLVEKLRRRRAAEPEAAVAA